MEDRLPFQSPWFSQLDLWVFFSVVIALFKDIPDIVGDKIYGIRSFTVRLGQERVFWICISLLEMAYVVAVLVGASSSCLWSKCITVVGHVGLASLLWNRTKSIDFQSKTAITSFYMFIWKLFYVEYLLIPFVRWISRCFPSHLWLLQVVCNCWKPGLVDPTHNPWSIHMDNSFKLGWFRVEN